MIFFLSSKKKEKDWPILYSSDFQENAKSKIVAQVFSDPFTVYSAKKVCYFMSKSKLSKYNISIIS